VTTQQFGRTDRAPSGDGIATVALFLYLVAMVAFAVCVGNFALGHVVLAVKVGSVALAAFGCSVAIFVWDGRSRKGTEAVTPGRTRP
jgi:hypothetical protein